MGVASASQTVTKIVTPTSRAQADALLGRYAEVCAQLDQANEKLNAELTAVRERSRPLLERLDQQVTAINFALALWAEKNRKKEFAGGQTLEALHGTLGFRCGKPCLVPIGQLTWEAVAARLKGKFARFRRTEVIVDKQAIHKAAGGQDPQLTKKDLAAIGLKLEQPECFYIRLKEL